MDPIENIEYDKELESQIQCIATTESGETYKVLVDSYYTNDHRLIARAQTDNVPDHVATEVEEYVQKQYDQ